jgi:hypothetical protein
MKISIFSEQQIRDDMKSTPFGKTNVFWLA